MRFSTFSAVALGSLVASTFAAPTPSGVVPAEVDASVAKVEVGEKRTADVLAPITVILTGLLGDIKEHCAAINKTVAGYTPSPPAYGEKPSPPSYSGLPTPPAYTPTPEYPEEPEYPEQPEQPEQPEHPEDPEEGSYGKPPAGSYEPTEEQKKDIVKVVIKEIFAIITLVQEACTKLGELEIEIDIKVDISIIVSLVLEIIFEILCTLKPVIELVGSVVFIVVLPLLGHVIVALLTILHHLLGGLLPLVAEILGSVLGPVFGILGEVVHPVLSLLQL